MSVLFATTNIFLQFLYPALQNLRYTLFLRKKLQLFVDNYKELLYYHVHNLITGNEEKSKCTSLAKRAFVMVQEGAGGDIEDGLGADGLRCMHLGRPGAPVTVLEY